MRTFRHNLLVAVCLFCGIGASAQNVKKIELGGIHYMISSDFQKASVIDPNPDDQINDYHGDIFIPERIGYDGVEYIVSSIDSKAFAGSAITSLIMPNTIESIGGYAFKGATYLENITMSENLKMIMSCAFVDCSSLTSIKIPKTTEMFGMEVFSNCSSLVSIVVDPENPSFDSREDCNCIIDTKTNSIMYGCSSSTIPADITSINDKAFKGCGITSIQIPDAIDYVGSSAFQGCASLESVVLSKKMTRLYPDVFSSCSSLKEIVIPAGITHIDRSALRYCPSMAKMTVEEGNKNFDSRNNSNCIIETSTDKIVAGCKSTVFPAGIQSIGDFAFSGSGITSVVIPEGVVSIGEESFAGCKELESIEIMKDVKAIGRFAFYACPKLNSIKVSPDNLFYDSHDDSNCLICIGTNTVVTGCSTSVIPADVEIIENRAFSYSGITHIDIPNSIFMICEHAFSNCPLTSVTFLHQTGSCQLEDNAFFNCPSLETINSYAKDGLVAFRSNVFEVEDDDVRRIVYEMCALNVPAGAASAYADTAGWDLFYNVNETLADDPSGIAETEDSDIQVLGENGRIWIKGLKGELPVVVYDVSGVQVYKNEAVSGSLDICLQNKGIYIVDVADQKFKVRL